MRSLRAEGHQALRSPRQVARFLCGLASPATTKAKLTKHHSFGRLAALDPLKGERDLATPLTDLSQIRFV